MENTTTPAVTPISVGIRYGLIVGIVGIIINFILNTTGMGFKMPMLAFAVSLALWIVGLMLADKYFKQHNGGFMTYGQGVVIGLMLGIIYGILSGVFTYIYIKFLDPSYVTSVQEYTRQTMANFNLPEEAMEKAIEGINEESLASPMAILKGVFGGALGGLIMSLIVSAFTKNNRPEFE